MLTTSGVTVTELLSGTSKSREELRYAVADLNLTVSAVQEGYRAITMQADAMITELAELDKLFNRKRRGNVVVDFTVPHAEYIVPAVPAFTVGGSWKGLAERLHA